MKVLFSGFRKKLFKDNTSLFGDFMEDSEFLKSDQTLAAIYKATVEGGHEVEGPRMIQFQEDLSQYDCVISEMSVPNVFGANGLVNMLWAIANYRKVALVIGHWDIKSMYGGINQLYKNPQKMFGGFIEYQDSLLYEEGGFAQEALQMIADGRCPSAINVFPWGDRSKLETKYKPGFEYYFDPTRLVTTPEWYDGFHPIDGWLTGSFEPFVQKQIDTANLSWGSTLVGYPRETKMSPEGLFTLMKEYKGTLVHGYHHAGSGYYRSRYQQAMNLGCIIAHLDQQDRSMFAGTPFCWGPKNIEGTSDTALNEVLENQREWFDENTWNFNTFVTWVNGTFLPEIAAI